MGVGHDPVRLQLAEPAAYARWAQQHDTLDDGDREAIRADLGNPHRRWPTVSLVMLAAPDRQEGHAAAAIASVLAQLYPRWELWAPPALASWADGRTGDRRIRALPRFGSTSDPAETFNTALAAASGAFIVPVLPDVVLAEHALYEVARAADEAPDAGLVFSDEDRLDASGRRCRPWFKTAWDPDLMLGRNAVGHLAAHSRALLDRLGGMRDGLPSVDLALYDLALRAGSASGPGRVRHIPTVLCHRRCAPAAAPDRDAEGARAVVRRHLAEEAGEPQAEVLPAPLAHGWNRVVRPVPDPAPLVSVIVPTRDAAHLLECCADAVLSRTDYAPLELVIVDNGSREPSALALLGRLARDRRVRVIRHPGPFNYPALNNHAAREARGEVLVLLNNDTDALHPGWLREMVSQALRPEVGAVGAKLLFADGRVQHAGAVLGPDGAVTHQFRFFDRADPGPGGELALARTVLVVTGACVAMRRSVFFEVGGLDERNLPVAFNDMDLCLRAGDHGYRVVWTPFAELTHLESASRGPNDTPEKQAQSLAEWEHFRRTWSGLLEADPFHNPNLVFGWDAVSFAGPPRREPPWRRAGPAVGALLGAEDGAESAAGPATPAEPAWTRAERAQSAMRSGAAHRTAAARREAAEAAARAARAEAALADAAAGMERLEAAFAGAEARADRAEATLTEVAARASQAEAEAARLVGDLSSTARERDAVLNSTIWRAAGPLRAVGRRLPTGLRRGLRGGAELAWRTVTGNLPHVLRGGRPRFLRGAAPEAAVDPLAAARPPLRRDDGQEPVQQGYPGASVGPGRRP